MADGTHNGEFSIVRHEILDDDKFEAVYDDDTLLATWLRLLMAADKAWPSPAPIPAGARARAVDKLVTAGLIERQPHGHYIVHGMAAERAKRAERFKKAAQARYAKQSNAGATQ